MKVAIISEGSTKNHNHDIVGAMEGLGQDVCNVGMTGGEGETDLSYVETGLMTALLLNTGAVDFVIGGCGTGQGYMNMALQFPGVFCGLIADPVEAFLFAKVNAGNCVSLPLNKGFGLGADINLRYIFEILFRERFGEGYPPTRAELQNRMRGNLVSASHITHRPMTEILKKFDQETIHKISSFSAFVNVLSTAPPSELRDLALGQCSVSGARHERGRKEGRDGTTAF